MNSPQNTQNTQKWNGEEFPPILFVFGVFCGSPSCRWCAFQEIFDHGFPGFHGWRSRRFLSVPPVKSVVTFLWWRLPEFQQVTLKVLHWEERDKRLVIKEAEMVA